MSRLSEILDEWPSLAIIREPRSRLYNMLCRAMEACELCASDEESAAYMRTVVARREKEKRSYVEAGSDVYVRVCRFLFVNDSRHNVSRYAVALRAAAGQGYTSATLFSALVAENGVNGFTRYNRRKTTCPHCGGAL